MNIHKIFILFLLLVGVFSSCQEKEFRIPITLESFADMADVKYRVDADLLNESLRHVVLADTDRETPDIQARRHYLDGGQLVWVTRNGISSKADTLLTYLATVDSIGFSSEKFCYSSLSSDLQRARDLDFDSDKNSRNNINKVYARLEYRLTKAFLRYVEGMRFGFVNPYDAFNRLDVRDSSGVYTSYRSLYDVPTKRPDAKFVSEAFAVMAGNDKAVGTFLAASRPENPLYQLLEKLKAGGLGKAMKIKILCNMERCRWRQYDNPWQHEKYVVVNIPSFHLMAIDHQDTLSMRIGCGASKTKTPILNSHIKRMELNPQWFVPRSIVLHDMIHRVGNHGYFRARNYYVREVATGKEVDLDRVTRSMLISGAYGIAQRGGKGNALGRIIFRFDNNFSVFLHDTNSKGVFGQEDRGVSHGCIRIEKPYDFAVFLLADKNEKLKEKIYYSMTADSLANKKLVVNNVKVNPQVPLFITYYTLYPLAGGRIAEYSDVYGFDAVIFDMLRKYL